MDRRRFADRADALERLGDPATADAALVWFRRVAEAAPASAPAWFDLAGAYDALGREAEAEAAYRKIRALGLERLQLEDRPRWHVQMGSTLRLLGRLEESRQVLAEGLQAYHDDAALSAFAALTEFAAGDPVEGARFLMQAVLASADPSIAFYRRALAQYAAEFARDVAKARLAVEADLPTLDALMTLAISENLKPYLTAEQIDASRAVMGLDTALVTDRTYWVVEEGGAIVGCGGWSRCATLYGGDHSAGRDAALLDPARDPARVRAMYTHPDHVRRGIGGMILDLCEAAAAAEGFRRLELVATLSGEPLYRKHGFSEIERFEDGGVPLVRMGKEIGGPT